MTDPINLSDDWKEVIADWQGDFTFMGSNLSGGSIQMGSIGGSVDLVSPMELILLGLAGCTGIDIISILWKMRERFEKFQVQVKGKRAENHPRIYTDIEVIYHFWGEDLDPKSVERAIDLSEGKFCSASAILRASANICSNYVIHAEDGNSPQLRNF